MPARTITNAGKNIAAVATAAPARPGRRVAHECRRNHDWAGRGLTNSYAVDELLADSHPYTLTTSCSISGMMTKPPPNSSALALRKTQARASRVGRPAIEIIGVAAYAPASSPAPGKRKERSE